MFCFNFSFCILPSGWIEAERPQFISDFTSVGAFLLDVIMLVLLAETKSPTGMAPFLCQEHPGACEQYPSACSLFQGHLATLCRRRDDFGGVRFLTAGARDHSCADLFSAQRLWGDG